MDNPKEQQASLVRKWDAEAEKFREETRNAALRADLAELELEEKKRLQAETLAEDKYHHVYNFHDEVSSHSVDKCIDQLASWVRMAKCPLEIEIVFHSPGGEMMNGLALFDFIKILQSKGHTVNTMALGMAASMAAILLQAGTVRRMGREAWVLIHEAQFGAIGTTGQVEDTVEWVKMIHKRILNIFAERSNLTVRQLERRWKRKDWWLSSVDCLKYGLVDEVR